MQQSSSTVPALRSASSVSSSVSGGGPDLLVRVLQELGGEGADGVGPADCPIRSLLVPPPPLSPDSSEVPPPPRLEHFVLFEEGPFSLRLESSVGAPMIAKLCIDGVMARSNFRLLPRGTHTIRDTKASLGERAVPLRFEVGDLHRQNILLVDSDGEEEFDGDSEADGGDAVDGQQKKKGGKGKKKGSSRSVSPRHMAPTASSRSRSVSPRSPSAASPRGTSRATSPSQWRGGDGEARHINRSPSSSLPVNAGGRTSPSLPRSAEKDTKEKEKLGANTTAKKVSLAAEGSDAHRRRVWEALAPFVGCFEVAFFEVKGDPTAAATAATSSSPSKWEVVDKEAPLTVVTLWYGYGPQLRAAFPRLFGPEAEASGAEDASAPSDGKQRLGQQQKVRCSLCGCAGAIVSVAGADKSPKDDAEAAAAAKSAEVKKKKRPSHTYTFSSTNELKGAAKKEIAAGWARSKRGGVSASSHPSPSSPSSKERVDACHAKAARNRKGEGKGGEGGAGRSPVTAGGEVKSALASMLPLMAVSAAERDAYLSDARERRRRRSASASSGASASSSQQRHRNSVGGAGGASASSALAPFAALCYACSMSSHPLIPTSNAAGEGGGVSLSSSAPLSVAAHGTRSSATASASTSAVPTPSASLSSRMAALSSGSDPQRYLAAGRRRSDKTPTVHAAHADRFPMRGVAFASPFTPHAQLRESMFVPSSPFTKTSVEGAEGKGAKKKAITIAGGEGSKKKKSSRTASLRSSSAGKGNGKQRQGNSTADGSLGYRDDTVRYKNPLWPIPREAQGLAGNGGSEGLRSALDLAKESLRRRASSPGDDDASDAHRRYRLGGGQGQRRPRSPWRDVCDPSSASSPEAEGPSHDSRPHHPLSGARSPSLTVGVVSSASASEARGDSFRRLRCGEDGAGTVSTLGGEEAGEEDEEVRDGNPQGGFDRRSPAAEKGANDSSLLSFTPGGPTAVAPSRPYTDHTSSNKAPLKSSPPHHTNTHDQTAPFVDVAPNAFAAPSAGVPPRARQSRHQSPPFHDDSSVLEGLGDGSHRPPLTPPLGYAASSEPGARPSASPEASSPSHGDRYAHPFYGAVVAPNTNVNVSSTARRTEVVFEEEYGTTAATATVPPPRPLQPSACASPQRPDDGVGGASHGGVHNAFFGNHYATAHTPQHVASSAASPSSSSAGAAALATTMALRIAQLESALLVAEAEAAKGRHEAQRWRRRYERLRQQRRQKRKSADANDGCLEVSCSESDGFSESSSYSSHSGGGAAGPTLSFSATAGRKRVAVPPSPAAAVGSGAAPAAMAVSPYRQRLEALSEERRRSAQRQRSRSGTPTPAAAVYFATASGSGIGLGASRRSRSSGSIGGIGGGAAIGGGLLPPLSQSQSAAWGDEEGFGEGGGIRARSEALIRAIVSSSGGGGGGASSQASAAASPSAAAYMYQQQQPPAQAAAHAHADDDNSPSVAAEEAAHTLLSATKRPNNAEATTITNTSEHTTTTSHVTHEHHYHHYYNGAGPSAAVAAAAALSHHNLSVNSNSSAVAAQQPPSTAVPPSQRQANTGAFGEANACSPPSPLSPSATSPGDDMTALVGSPNSGVDARANTRRRGDAGQQRTAAMAAQSAAASPASPTAPRANTLNANHSGAPAAAVESVVFVSPPSPLSSLRSPPAANASPMVFSGSGRASSPPTTAPSPGEAHSQTHVYLADRSGDKEERMPPPTAPLQTAKEGRTAHQTNASASVENVVSSTAEAADAANGPLYHNGRPTARGLSHHQRRAEHAGGGGGDSSHRQQSVGHPLNEAGEHTVPAAAGHANPAPVVDGYERLGSAAHQFHADRSPSPFCVVHNTTAIANASPNPSAASAPQKASSLPTQRGGSHYADPHNAAAAAAHRVHLGNGASARGRGHAVVADAHEGHAYYPQQSTQGNAPAAQQYDMYQNQQHIGHNAHQRQQQQQQQPWAQLSVGGHAAAADDEVLQAARLLVAQEALRQQRQSADASGPFAGLNPSLPRGAASQSLASHRQQNQQQQQRSARSPSAGGHHLRAVQQRHHRLYEDDVVTVLASALSPSLTAAHSAAASPLRGQRGPSAPATDAGGVQHNTPKQWPAHAHAAALDTTDGWMPPSLHLSDPSSFLSADGELASPLAAARRRF